MSYTNIFGGSVIQPSDVMYIQLTLTGNTQLSWPTQYVDNPATPFVVARMTDVTTNDANYIIKMPAADQVSQGMSTIFRNIGANTFIVSDILGNQIVQIAAGQAWNIYPTDNSTPQGTWGIFQQGTGTSSADATSLAGNGLIPLSGKLNIDLPTSVLVANYNASVNDLAKLFINNSGSINFVLPVSGSIFDGFYVAINNAYGSGSVTISAADNKLIDNNTVFILGQEQSSYFVYNNSSGVWASLGYGVISTFGYNQLNLNVSGNTDITLTTQQSQAQIQTFTGNLTGDINVIYDQIVGEWILNNSTTGNFTLSVKTTNGMSEPFLIPQNSTLFLYSNSVSFFAPSVPSTNINFPSGSATNPSITFSVDPATGLYLASVGNLGITVAGTQRINISNASTTLSNNLIANGTSTFNGNVSLTGANTLTTGTGLTSLGGALTVTGISTFNQNVSITGIRTLTVGTGLTSLGGALTVTGLTSLGGNLNVSGTSNLQGLTTANAIQNINGTVGAAAYSFGLLANTGIYYDGPNSALSFSWNGTDYLKITAAQITFGQTPISNNYIFQPGTLNLLPFIGAPATPGFGGLLYVNNADGGLYYKGTSGNAHLIQANS